MSMSRRYKAVPKKSSNEPVCDICWIPCYTKGTHQTVLLKCRVCSVQVHPECYELFHYAESTKEEQEAFTCWACQAVGTTVKFRERDTDGNRLKKIIHSRPTECCLCGTPDSQNMHAMHPLYDDYGQKARQIRLDNGQPAWVHTLCALFVANRTQGLVYACGREGYYGADEDPERIVMDDDSSVNSALVATKGEDTDGYTHHFAYTMEKWYGPNQPHVKLAREHAEKLRCLGCRKSDRGRNCYRFAIQCMAGEEDEFKKLKSRNGKLLHFEDNCVKAWHVGCARYCKNSKGEYPGAQNLFYFPGDKDRDPVCNIMCREHATDIYAAYKLEAHFPPNARIAAPDEYDMGVHSEDEFEDVDNGDDDNDDDIAFDDAGSPSSRESPPRKTAQHDVESMDLNQSDSPGKPHPKPRPVDQKGKKQARRSSTMNSDTNGKPPAKQRRLYAVRNDSSDKRKRRARAEDSFENTEIVLHDCHGYTLDFLLTKAPQHKADMVEKCFRRICADAMENMAKAVRKGDEWPFEPLDSVGALFSMSEGTAWCNLRKRQSSDVPRYFCFHSPNCLGQTETVGEYCSECAKIFKEMKHAMKEAKKQEESEVGVKEEEGA